MRILVTVKPRPKHTVVVQASPIPKRDRQMVRPSVPNGRGMDYATSSSFRSRPVDMPISDRGKLDTEEKLAWLESEAPKWWAARRLKAIAAACRCTGKCECG